MYIDHDLLAYIYQTNKRPRRFFDRFVVFFVISDPAVIVLDRFALIPTPILLFDNDNEHGM